MSKILISEGGIPSFRDNSFNTVRLLAALQVFYGHAVVHLKLSSNEYVSNILGIFQGVPIFFMLSGFLIWNSIDRTPDLKSFVKKRVLRLYPELWCAVFLSILSIIILYDEFHVAELAIFGLGQATIFQFWTPDSLRGFGCGTPNGSLASIFMIVQFYAIVWFLKKLRPGKILWSILLLVGLAMNMLSPVLENLLPTMLYKLWDVSIFPYFWLFMIGAFICDHFDQFVPIMKKYWFIGAILLVVQAFLHLDIPGEYGLIKTILQCFTWVGFAYALPKWNVRRDISYGIFLYHMVVVNAFIQIGLVGSWGWFIVVAIIVIALSIISNIFANAKRFAGV